MRHCILLLLVAITSYVDSYALIGIGYGYKDVLFWRYWEMEHGLLVPRILVYNTSDTAISFTMRKEYVEGGCTPSGTTKEQYERMDAEYAKDTIVATSVILPHQYGIFVISRGQYGVGYNGAFVNGKHAGITEKMAEPNKELINKYKYRYYSYEGQYGTHCFGLICTDQIFTKRGDTGNMMIYFDFSDKTKWRSFKGIGDVSATVLGGLDNATINVKGQSHLITTELNKVRFYANIDNSQPYKMDISYTVSHDTTYPDLDITFFFENGNGGIRSPIFIE